MMLDGLAMTDARVVDETNVLPDVKAK